MNPHLAELFRKYFDNTATEAEIIELASLAGLSESETDLRAVIHSSWEKFSSDESVLTNEARERIVTNILGQEKVPVVPSVSRVPWWRYAAAAAILILLAGTYLIIKQRNNEVGKLIAVHSKFKNDILPGSNKAILTLASGKRIVLDSAAIGQLASQGNVQVIKSGNSDLVYRPDSGNQNSAEITYNTLSTPRGGQHHLILPDNTQVWLNAASSITYPTVFNGNDRKVSITGEAYFEVAHDVKKPFHVSIKGMDIEVLGTHFNVNGYDDETAIKTTLLEGSVQIHASDKQALLKPGQQAQWENGANNLGTISDVDSEEVIAWKNGKFRFGELSDINAIMRQIARWYDVDVEYQGTFTEHISGTISRNVNVSKVLEMLELTGSLKFEVDGRKVIVMPPK